MEGAPQKRYDAESIKSDLKEVYDWTSEQLEHLSNLMMHEREPGTESDIKLIDQLMIFLLETRSRIDDRLESLDAAPELIEDFHKRRDDLLGDIRALKADLEDKLRSVGTHELRIQKSEGDPSRQEHESALMHYRKEEASVLKERLQQAMENYQEVVALLEAFGFGASSK